MDFSPIQIQRKAAAPPGGSSNPFDDFDFVTDAVNPASLSPQVNSMWQAPSSPMITHTLTRYESVDSEDDPFGLFSDDTPKSSPVRPNVRKASGLRNEIKQDFDTEEEVEETDKAQLDEDAAWPKSTVIVSAPSSFKEAVIPFLSDDAELYQFLCKPLEEGTFLRMTVMWDDVNKIYKLIQDSSHRIVLTALKRSDGLKAFSMTTNYSILMLPTDRAVALAREMKSQSKTGSLIEPVRVAKLRGNTLGSQYSLFDQGKSPSKAAGVMEVRRELMSVRFETVSSIYTRRATYCYLPNTGQPRRPTSKDEMLHERAKKHDPSVISLFPHVPGTNRLPRFEDFQGFASTHSVKNLMLRQDGSDRYVFRFGRQHDRLCYRLEFSYPFSVLSAFAVALASCDTKIHPNRQF